MRNIILFLTLLNTGCTHKYFYPLTPNIPMHSAAGELTLSGNYTFNDRIDGVEGQLAYAATDHLGLIGNFIYVKGVEDKVNDYGSGKMGEAGIGYFTNKGKLHLAVYAGGGIGDQYHRYRSDTVGYYEADMNFNRIFIQPSIGYKSRIFEGAFTTRFSRLDYSKVTSDIDPVLDPYNYDIVNLLDADRPYYLFEPALTIRIGSERIKFQGNLGMMYELRDKGTFVRSAVSAGIHVRLGRKTQQN